MSKKASCLILVLLLSILACDNQGCNKRQPPQITSETGGTLVVAVNADIDNFHPILSRDNLAQDIQGLMFLNLLRQDENFKWHTSEYKPCLTKSWRFSEDFLELTLFMHDDVKWSDGVPVSSFDVKFTYEKMNDPMVPYPNKTGLDFIESCTVQNDYEITFRFKEVYANELSDVSFIPLPKHVFGNIDSQQFINHPFKDNPIIVNGPYRLKKWDRNQLIELEINPEYSFKRANLDRIVFRVIPDQTSRLTNLKTGQVDLVQAIPADQITDFQNYPGIEILNYPSLNYDFIYWLGSHPYFSDKNVRRALTMAIDRKQIVDVLLSGYGRECLSPVHPAHKEFYNPDLKPLPYDRDTAKEMLATAGWTDSNADGILDKNGRKFEFKMKTNIGNQRRIDVITMIQADLKKVGVSVTQEMVEFSLYIEQMSNRDYEAAVGGMAIGTVFNPADIWHSKAIVDGYNWFNYSNSRIDSLINTGRRTLDRDRARSIWFDFQKELYADQPCTFLYVRDNLDGINKKFKGIKTWPPGIFFNVDEWWIEEEQ